MAYCISQRVVKTQQVTYCLQQITCVLQQLSTWKSSYLFFHVDQNKTSHGASCQNKPDLRPLGRWSLLVIEWKSTRSCFLLWWKGQYVHDGHLGGEQTEFSSSKELHGGHLGGDSLAFPFVPIQFTTQIYLSLSFAKKNFIFFRV